jgi:hypothetical protein
MKNSSTICFLSIVVIHLAAYFVFLTIYPKINTNLLFKEVFYSAIILSVGTIIMYINYQPSQFVSRFMIITVFQMLAILSFLLALVYLKIKPLQTHGILFIIAYLSGMVAQTASFLFLSKKTS